MAVCDPHIDRAKGECSHTLIHLSSGLHRGAFSLRARTPQKYRILKGHKADCITNNTNGYTTSISMVGISATPNLYTDFNGIMTFAVCKHVAHILLRPDSCNLNDTFWTDVEMYYMHKYRISINHISMMYNYILCI